MTKKTKASRYTETDQAEMSGRAERENEWVAYGTLRVGLFGVKKIAVKAYYYLTDEDNAEIARCDYDCGAADWYSALTEFHVLNGDGTETGEIITLR